MGIMKRYRALTAFLMAFTLFNNSARAASEDTFWQWFTKNDGRLFSFETNQEAIFDELSHEMGHVNRDLTFEFGPVLPSGQREFVISAGGIKSAFPSVEALYAKAPKLKHWVWVKFRPRRVPINDVEFGGKSIPAKDVHYLLAKDGDKAGIVLFFDGYNEKEKTTFGQIGYLYLDEALGEYAVEMQVGFIEFQPRTSKYFSKAAPLSELRAHFDEYLSSRAH
nr:hypothetical protein [Nevskia sp.]